MNEPIHHGPLILYIKVGCGYCAKVLQAGQELGLVFDLKTVANPAVAEELIARGGKRQMPYLVDVDAGVEMYESDAIVEYLHQKFGPKE
ncbi:MAG: hypothetical protein AB199_03460 [Parcubacteria bacterium C7867-004]|nr:MAG: hypothetical protein AB199_03460 [Parcubacteria bacterium C7867-004]